MKWMPSFTLPSHTFDRARTQGIPTSARAVEEWILSPRGRETAALLAALRERYGDVVEISVGNGGAGVTIRPHRPEACDLLWQVHPDTISVTAGSGSFTIAGIDELRDFAEAVASGRVRDERRDDAVATVVTPTAGPEWVDAVESPDEGWVLMPTAAARRLRAEPRGYSAWR